MHHHPDRIAHATAFVTPVVEHWLEREIAQWVYPMKDRSDDPSHHERTLLPRSYISLQNGRFDTYVTVSKYKELLIRYLLFIYIYIYNLLLQPVSTAISGLAVSTLVGFVLEEPSASKTTELVLGDVWREGSIHFVAVRDAL